MNTPVQFPLFDVMSLSNPTCRAVGAHGEVLARHMLCRSGYEVATTGRGARRGDLLAIAPDTGEFWRVEVKTARRCKDGKWRFTLVKNGHTDHRDSDVVLLLAVTITGHAVPFLIPVADILNAWQITITSTPTEYTGKYARYRRQDYALKLEA
jgi:hypothetical protein